MPGLAKWGRRADTSGARLGGSFGEFVREVLDDPEMRRGCSGRFPGSSVGTGTGMTGGSGRGNSEDESKRKRGHGGAFESLLWSGRAKVVEPFSTHWLWTRGESHALLRRNGQLALKQKMRGTSRGLEMARLSIHRYKTSLVWPTVVSSSPTEPGPCASLGKSPLHTRT